MVCGRSLLDTFPEFQTRASIIQARIYKDREGSALTSRENIGRYLPADLPHTRVPVSRPLAREKPDSAYSALVLFQVDLWRST